ncbi:hypothetical protein VF14_18345 [Nostoc linckia z18]|uniref:Uncharacterized protein n=2 Tax=Nostoc linckia TaxID=92942 RepID=A0A9Q5Z975_NOSLI|nr:hypothetical protein [Nostoc linckia]PHJ53462.1 hypothetical protein VF02_37230 [Nostoc linckia z1]PHJ81970.1 hypothetical protein VF07_29185 [Nostoc linckia z6]PHJ92868.1 hypothetical protein VF04_27900 [Nostoc linckia z7]PHK00809.1 hypothetical protein VF08_23345 [Nostoc linckia z8]PHK09313.1 hypothetical protein VF09_15960 [Nostoc linckia z9]
MILLNPVLLKGFSRLLGAAGIAVAPGDMESIVITVFIVVALVEIFIEYIAGRKSKVEVKESLKAYEAMLDDIKINKPKGTDMNLENINKALDTGVRAVDIAEEVIALLARRGQVVDLDAPAKPVQTPEQRLDDLRVEVLQTLIALGDDQDLYTSRAFISAGFGYAELYLNSVKNPVPTE